MQRFGANTPTSANTSFNSMWSSQQTQVESAATSFTTDGASDDDYGWKNAGSSSAGHQLELNATALQADNFQKNIHQDQALAGPQNAHRDSTSTYGTVHDDDFEFVTRNVESEMRPKSYKTRTQSEILPPTVDTRMHAHTDKSRYPVREPYNIRNIPNLGLFVNNTIDFDYGVPYFVRFICWRLVSESCIPIEDLISLVRSPASHETADSFWTEVTKRYQSNSKSVFLKQKESNRVWQAEKRDFEGYTFKGRIIFNSRRSDPVFGFQALPIQFDKSCRFQRKFGSDRFLYLTVPRFDNKMCGRFTKTEMEQIENRFKEWLCMEHAFCGRKWRAFHIEPMKSKSKRRHEDTHDKRVVLFATEGCNIKSPCTVGAMMNWFLPFSNNGHQFFCKAYARFDLGLSRTVPTLIFRPSQVKYVDDMSSTRDEEATEFNDPTLKWEVVPDGEVMNDGCSLISVAAAREIWRRYREAVGIQGSQALPSVFQGRIGGAKGMWIVSGESFSRDPKDLELWIQINDSQLKFKPHSEDLDLSDDQFDPIRLTFEVTNYSTAPAASELHISFIPILIDRGVPRDVIARLMTTRLDADRAELLNALADPARTYEWLHRNGAKTSFGLEALWNAALPVAQEEKIKLMLESGFSATKTPYLANALQRFVQNKQVIKESKLRTPLGKSTFLFGIADPLSVLKPGEVHVQFSGRFVDELTEESYLNLKNMDCLVARQPACRRSDIQKVRTIVHPELSHLIDVVVFPSIGRQPLANKLQGGDYDGDLFWLCWEPELVNPFLNAPAPVLNPEPSAYGIKTDKRRLASVMNLKEPTSVDRFLQEAFQFRSDSSLLGHATVLLEKLSYKCNSIYTTKLDQLCDLHDLLVDAPKQGYVFTENDFNVFMRTILGLTSPPPKPAHKVAMEDCLKTADVEDIERLRLKNYRHKSNRVLDFLYFDVFRLHNSETIKQLRDKFSKSDAEPDETLLQINRYLEGKQLGIINDELRLLREKVVRLYNQWSLGFHKCTTAEQKNAHSEACYEKYQAIQPKNTDQAEVKSWLEPYCGSNDLSWRMIKASTLYARYHWPEKAEFVFKMAGMELTELKARSFSRSRFIIASVHANMKPKRIKAPAELDEEEEEEGLSDDDFDII